MALGNIRDLNKALVKLDEIQYRAGSSGMGFNFKQYIEELFGHRPLESFEVVKKINPDGNIEEFNNTNFYGDDFNNTSLNDIWWETFVTGTTITFASSVCTMNSGTSSGNQSRLLLIMQDDTLTNKNIFEAKVKATRGTGTTHFNLGICGGSQGLTANTQITWGSATANTWIPKCDNAGSETNGSNYTITDGTWNRFKIILKANSAKFYINEVFKEEITTNVTDNSISIGFLCRKHAAGTNSTLKIDWTLIRWRE